VGQLDGRVAVVTGGTRGVGRAIAEAFLDAGARVVVNGRSEAKGRVAVQEIDAGEAVHFVAGDVMVRDDCERIVDEATGRYGRIDILVNNAGIAGPTGPLEAVADDAWDEVMRIDLRSVFLGCRAVLAGMKARGYGRIVNVASIAGKEGNPNAVPYSAAKAGVIGLTKALAKEVASFGIYVNAVAPAVIDTPILQQVPQTHIDYMVQRIPLGRMGRPEEVAALIAWLASDEASFTTGQCVDISGGRATY
jgi:NAD(P)-dependent dehydrogenase (short-subunit alcohol dehydrogenase family)